LINLASAWFWLGWLKRRDVFAVKKGQRRVVPLFVFLGMLSSPLCLPFYAYSPWNSMVGGEVSFFFLVNAPSEELAKFFVFLVLAKKTKSVKDPADAAIQGASVGLGFALVENVLYSLWIDPAALLFRATVCVAGHMTWGAISGFSWGAADYYFTGRKPRGAWGYPVLGLCVASALHAGYNSLPFGDGGILPICFTVVAFACLSSGLSDSVRLSPYYNFPLADWRKALAWVEHGIDRDPGNWLLRQRRGMYHLAGGLLENAKEDFGDAEAFGGGDYPLVWLQAIGRLEGKLDWGELAVAVLGLPPSRREIFARSATRAFSRLPEGRPVAKEIAALVLPPPPPRPRRREAPAWDSKPGLMLRSVEGKARARALRDGSGSVRVRRAATAGRAFRAEPGPRERHFAERRARRESRLGL
ncbi:MAG: PrsW family intramembrane metalloprotease, partial [Spirochaetaceae bacterium]|nr:PrsW family intramembrane metalloprotease [Spirochaetaceae bacterium]